MASRDSQRRVAVSFRIARPGLARVDDRAVVEHVERSEMIRRMLAYALRTMPKGWKP